MAIRIIQDIESAYIKHQLETRDVFLTKRALQYICELYRRNNRFNPSVLFGIENSIVGLIQTSDDDKIKRWALNTLALIGRPDVSLKAVMTALENNSHDAAIVGAAIAAIFKLERNNAYQLLKKKNQFSHDLIVLSALQNTPANGLDIKGTRIDIESAEPEILKLALITVGLGKAPENIFHPRYPNSKIVQVLGGHDDPIVAQYSVWAIVENPGLSARDLGIDLAHVQDKPENVRAWIYQLFASEEVEANRRHEMVLLGSEDRSVIARVGLATGLRDAFYAGLDKLVPDWHLRESDPEVAELTLDHMVRQYERSDSYEKLVRELFQHAGNGSPRRRRMLAMAAGTKIYGQLRRSEAISNDLLNESSNVTNIGTLNIGTIQAGAVSIGGNAINLANTGNYLSAEQIQTAQQILSDARKDLEGMRTLPSGQEKVLEELDAAIAEPTPSRLKRAASAIETLSGALTNTVQGIEAGEKLGRYGLQILELLSKLG